MLPALIAIAATAAALLPAAARPHHVRRLLVVTITTGFRHDSIPVAEETIKELGARKGEWETEYVRTEAEMREKMTAAGLARYDAVCFANTTGVLPLPDPAAFLQYIRNGHGFIAMHSGSDTFHEWPGQPAGQVSEYIKMLGAEFQTHHQQSAVELHALDARNPAARPVLATPEAATPPDLHAASYVHNHLWHVFDEMYLFKNVDRPALHVIFALNRHPDDGSAEAGQPGEYLVSWSKKYGRGRVFYTSLGHRQEVWRDPIYQGHVRGGILFALGTVKGGTAPNAPLAPAAR